MTRASWIVVTAIWLELGCGDRDREPTRQAPTPATYDAAPAAHDAVPEVAPWSLRTADGPDRPDDVAVTALSVHGEQLIALETRQPDDGEPASRLVTLSSCGRSAAWTPLVAPPGREVLSATATEEAELALTDQGLFRLADATEVWKKVGKGLPRDIRNLFGAAGGVVYATDSLQGDGGTKLYLSSDAGTTFQALDAPPHIEDVAATTPGAYVVHAEPGDDYSLVSFVAAKATPAEVTGGDRWFVVEAAGDLVVYSREGRTSVARAGSRTWTHESTQELSLGALLWTGSALVADHTSGLYTSTDGSSWIRLPDAGLPPALSDSEVVGLVVCGADLLALYAARNSLVARPLR